MNLSLYLDYSLPLLTLTRVLHAYFLPVSASFTLRIQQVVVWNALKFTFCVGHMLNNVHKANSNRPITL